MPFPTCTEGNVNVGIYCQINRKKHQIISLTTTSIMHTYHKVFIHVLLISGRLDVLSPEANCWLAGLPFRIPFSPPPLQRPITKQLHFTCQTASCVMVGFFFLLQQISYANFHALPLPEDVTPHPRRRRFYGAIVAQSGTPSGKMRRFLVWTHGKISHSRKMNCKLCEQLRPEEQAQPRQWILIIVCHVV